MLSVRVTRDRRGYDHVYLIEETRRRGRPEGRLVYWARLPGGLRVGREPFDEDTRAALERANPGIAFDWTALLKSLNASAAAARWSARQQQQPRSPTPPPATRDRDRGRPSPKRPPQQRTWREDGDEIPADAEGALAGSDRAAASPHRVETHVEPPAETPSQDDPSEERIVREADGPANGSAVSPEEPPTV